MNIVTVLPMPRCRHGKMTDRGPEQCHLVQGHSDCHAAWHWAPTPIAGWQLLTWEDPAILEVDEMGGAPDTEIYASHEELRRERDYYRDAYRELCARHSAELSAREDDTRPCNIAPARLRLIGRCARPEGHSGAHQDANGKMWAQLTPTPSYVASESLQRTIAGLIARSVADIDGDEQDPEDWMVPAGEIISAWKDGTIDISGPWQ